MLRTGSYMLVRRVGDDADDDATRFDASSRFFSTLPTCLSISNNSGVWSSIISMSILTYKSSNNLLYDQKKVALRSFKHVSLSIPSDIKHFGYASMK